MTDQSLEMDLYKIYNLPALHPKLKVEFTYQLEGEYLAITKNKSYAALPTAGEIRICKATGYLRLMNQALYPVEKIKSGVHVLYSQQMKMRSGHTALSIHKQVCRRTPQNNLESYILEREYPFAAEGVGI